MLKRTVIALLPLALLVLLPVIFRQRAEVPGADADRLVIITPHTESIRYEFDRAFRAYYREKTGRDVAIDWRSPGGTSDITRYVDDQFQGAFRRHWQAEHGDAAWTDAVAGAFNNRRIAPADPATPAAAADARRAFLASDVGIGIDIFFGGGQYDHGNQADMGHLVDAGMQAAHPEWFDPAIIPLQFSGETFYDKQGRYYPACLSTFGICYNPDRVAVAGDGSPPRRWMDLGEPRFFNQLGVADPTKSGSITKCFEMLIQEQMQAAVAAAEARQGDGKLSDADYDAALAAGWRAGMNLIQRIGANGRYFTDSASKIPRDVAGGDLSAGMAIDFYGRGQADFSAYQSGGKERLVYYSPDGGTSLSSDPIALMRGAPNREVAVMFIEFVLSVDGQKLWNYRVGEPGGPQTYALRRMPVRRDMFTPEHREHMSDGKIDPYEQAAGFVYHGGWTGPYFGLIRQHIRCMVLDSGEELKAAWAAIIAAGGPEAVPEAMAALHAQPYDYTGARDARNSLGTDGSPESVLAMLKVLRSWSDFHRDQYTEARRLAEAGR